MLTYLIRRVALIIPMFLGMLFAVVIGLPAGAVAAVRRGGVFDQTLMTISLLGYSTPIFWRRPRRIAPSPLAGEGRGEGGLPKSHRRLVAARPPHPNPLPQGERGLPSITSSGVAPC
jgi:hypothetical protein